MLQYDTYLSSYDTAFSKLNDATYTADVAAFNKVVTANNDTLKDWFTWVAGKQNKLPPRPCKPQVPDSAWNFLSYFGTTTIDNFSADQKANRYAKIKSLASASSVTAPVVADTLRTGYLQVHSDDNNASPSAWTYNFDSFALGHVFGKYGQGYKTMPTWKTTHGNFKQYSFQYTDPNTTAHGMLVSLFSYDTNRAVVTLDTYAVPFANNTHWNGAPIAPNITDPALNRA